MNGGKISLTNNYKENSSFFVSIAKGYKQGGFNLGTGLNISTFSDSIKYDPETLVNYELGLKDLSMGMSSDYKIAIKYKSTFLRIGSAILGPRTFKK